MGKLEQKLCLGIFKNIGIIGNLIGKKLIANELEFSLTVNNSLRKIDILAFDDDGKRDVFIEVQLGEGDLSHAKEFITLLDHHEVNRCDFVWIASEFNEKVLHQLKNKILIQNKSIELHLVSMNRDWIDEFKKCEIREFYALDDLYNRAKFFELDFSKVGSFKNEMTNDKSALSYFKKFEYNEHHHHKLLKRIINQMRKESQYPQLHFFKNFEKSRVCIGVGVDSVSAILATSPHRKTIFFSIEFNNNHRLFEKVMKRRGEISERLNNIVQFNEEKRKLIIELPNTYFTEKHLCDFIASASLILLERVYGEVIS